MGFTLLELLITLLIISILATIAYPTYSNYLTYTHRLAAKQTLMNTLINIEEYLFNHHHLPKKLGDLNIELNQIKPFYSIKYQHKDFFYRLIAEPIYRQKRQDTECGTLKIDSLGNKTISGTSTVENCW